ncbi:MAG: anti-sigma factor [Actinomycetota bacterium]
MNEIRNPSCADVAAALPALVDEIPSGERGPGPMTLAMRRHLSRCPECARDLEAYRSIRVTAAGLARATANPPAGLRDVLAAIPSGQTRLDEVRSHVARHRHVYVGGLAVALGATGAALWRARRRAVATA